MTRFRSYVSTVQIIRFACGVEYRQFPFERFPPMVAELKFNRWKALLIAVTLTKLPDCQKISLDSITPPPPQPKRESLRLFSDGSGGVRCDLVLRQSASVAGHLAPRRLRALQRRHPRLGVKLPPPPSFLGLSCAHPLPCCVTVNPVNVSQYHHSLHYPKGLILKPIRHIKTS